MLDAGIENNASCDHSVETDLLFYCNFILSFVAQIAPISVTENCQCLFSCLLEDNPEFGSSHTITWGWGGGFIDLELAKKLSGQQAPGIHLPVSVSHGNRITDRHHHSQLFFKKEKHGA